VTATIPSWGINPAPATGPVAPTSSPFLAIPRRLGSDERVVHLATVLDALGTPMPGAVATGAVVSLWDWAMDNRPDGNLKDVAPAVISRVAGWTGNHDAFRAALVSSGILDSWGMLTRWQETGGRAQASREARREASAKAAETRTPGAIRTAEWRARQRAEDVPTGVTRGVTRGVTCDTKSVTQRHTSVTVSDGEERKSQSDLSPTVNTADAVARDVRKRTRDGSSPPRVARVPLTAAHRAAREMLGWTSNPHEDARRRITAVVGDGSDPVAMERWRIALEAWVDNYPGRTGIEGPLDWFRDPSRQSRPKRPAPATGQSTPARAVPDGLIAALRLPATSNRRAAHTGVAEDAQKTPEPAVAPEVSGVLGNLMAPDPGPKKCTDELRRIALARAAEYARARGWGAPGSATSQPG
jgi:hypothetical protein